MNMLIDHFNIFADFDVVNFMGKTRDSKIISNLSY